MRPLEELCPDAVRDRAEYLALDQHWIDHAAAIMDDDVTVQRDAPGRT